MTTAVRTGTYCSIANLQLGYDRMSVHGALYFFTVNLKFIALDCVFFCKIYNQNHIYFLSYENECIAN